MRTKFNKMSVDGCSVQNEASNAFPFWQAGKAIALQRKPPELDESRTVEAAVQEQTLA